MQLQSRGCMIFALAFFKQKIRPISIVGVTLGLIGAIGLIYFSAEHAVSQSFTIYMMLPIIASASYGVLSMICWSFFRFSSIRF